MKRLALVLVLAFGAVSCLAQYDDHGTILNGETTDDEYGTVVGTSGGGIYGDEIIVVFTANEDYDYPDSLKSFDPPGRFDAIYGLAGRPHQEVSWFQSGDDGCAFNGTASDRNYPSRCNTAAANPDHPWTMTSGGFNGTIMHLDIDQINDFDGALITSAYYYERNNTNFDPPWTAAEGDTICVIPITRKSLQQWGDWYQHNNTCSPYIDRANTIAWPASHSESDTRLAYYQRWHDYQDIGEDESDFINPGMYTGTTYDVGDWLEFDVTEYVTWLAANPSYDWNIITALVTDPLVYQNWGGPIDTTSRYRSRLVITMRPLIDQGSKLPEFDFPMYASYNQGQFTSFNKADYDSIASLDLMTFQIEMFDERYKSAYEGFIDSVRTRNPNFLGLDYISLWGCDNGWAVFPVGSLRRDYFDIVNDNDFWLKDINGDEVEYVSYALFNQRLVNFSHAGADTVLSNFFAGRINASENSQDFTGVFIDFMNYADFPDWPCVPPGCWETIDLNEDTTNTYAEDQGEQLLYRESCINFVENLRAKVDNPWFIIAVNGPAWRYAAFAPYVDMGMLENIETSPPSWHSAFGPYQDQLSSDVLALPLVMYDMEGGALDPDDPAEEPVIVASLIGAGAATLSTDAPVNGRRPWYPALSDHGRLDLGRVIGNGFWEAASDTAYRQYEKGFVRAVVLASGGYPYEYVVVDTVSSAEDDTLLISDGWPRTFCADCSSGVSGTLSDGETVTISGTGFGTKPTAAPVVWDNLELDGTSTPVVGAPVDSIATIGMWENQGDLLFNDDTQRHANSNYNGKHNFTEEGTAGFDTGSSIRDTKWFIQYWVRLHDNFTFGSSGLPNIKIIRLYSGNGFTNNFHLNTSSTWDIKLNSENSGMSGQRWGPDVTAEYECVDEAFGHGCSDVTDDNWQQLMIGWEHFEDDFKSGEWILLQFETEQSTVDTADGIFRMWVDGNLVLDVDNLQTGQTGNNGSMYPLIVGWYESNNGLGSTPNEIYIDDAYADNSWARVELGNNAVYADCTHREIQPTTLWSDTSVTVTFNPGSFAPGATAYLFVIGTDGVPGDGFEVTLE